MQSEEAEGDARPSSRSRPGGELEDLADDLEPGGDLPDEEQDVDGAERDVQVPRCLVPLLHRRDDRTSAAAPAHSTAPTKKCRCRC